MTKSKAAPKPETVSVQIQRWPKPADGGGVFTTPAQMCEAIADLHDQYNYRGTLMVGDGEKMADTYFVEMHRGDEPGVRADMGQLFAYYLGKLHAMTADEYETITGSAP